MLLLQHSVQRQQGTFVQEITRQRGMSSKTAFWGSRKVQEGKAKAHSLKTKQNPTPVIAVGKWDGHKMEE